MRNGDEVRPRGDGLVLRGDGQGAGVIRGYASLFGVTDLAGDAIEPGAFGASIARRRAAGIRMLWQHEPGRPIGIWTTVEEDRTGLFVEGRLALSTAGGREAFALIEAGAVDGLSIGFKTRRARRGGAGEAALRRLFEIDLWEISVVTFPMQERARVLDIGAPPGGEREAGRIAAAVLGVAGKGAGARGGAAGRRAERPASPRQGVG